MLSLRRRATAIYTPASPATKPDGLEPRFSLPLETPRSSKKSLVIGGVQMSVFGLEELQEQSGEATVFEHHTGHLGDGRVDHYDVQHAERGALSERCVMRGDEAGSFWFKAIIASKLPDDDGWPGRTAAAEAGMACVAAGAHAFHAGEARLGSSHRAALPSACVSEKANGVCSAVYVRGDLYEKTDAVFGVEQSLIVDLESQYGVEAGSTVLRQGLVLASEKDTAEPRGKNAIKALNDLGLPRKLLDHLPLPDLD
ncbi:hypothetical protein LLEC1_04463 [Akanthomyces lecanii]|uniref:Uncharacterized protein n=1 Tax=Cordyceps confragosa TaxID=2714763 RepID=A0A179IDZ5_CORDF|nr:hypothetical protein LLEC1_04463 [Akanthomyces lecanii]